MGNLEKMLNNNYLKKLNSPDLQLDGNKLSSNFAQLESVRIPYDARKKKDEKDIRKPRKDEIDGLKIFLLEHAKSNTNKLNQ